MANVISYHISHVIMRDNTGDLAQHATVHIFGSNAQVEMSSSLIHIICLHQDTEAVVENLVYLLRDLKQYGID